jgi:glycosyltransferase involved in cell wall biosynthesis
MHVITTLGPAGAETMLFRIANAMDRSRFENEVVSLTGILDLADKIRGIGVPVRSLEMEKTFPNPLLVMRLARWIRDSRPDVIHTWMYHANLLGSLAARLAGNVPVVWAIHHGTVDRRVDRRRTMLVNRVCGWFSNSLPARIVCCSEAAVRAHENLGYAGEKLEVVPNGFDMCHVRPDPSARASLRAELGLVPESLLVGIAARFHRQKDHRNFIQAAARLHQAAPDVHFVLCGMNVDGRNQLLMDWVRSAGLEGRCHLLGAREDMPRIFAGIDIAAISSISEAFPVVLGEAMACGIPCVTTDVGDCAMIVGDTGLVVPPQNPEALAGALEKLIRIGPEGRRVLGIAARERVQQRFALAATVDRYQQIYEAVAGDSCDRTIAPSWA